MPDGQGLLFDERPSCAHCGQRIDGPRWEVRLPHAAVTVIVCAFCAHQPEYDRKRQLP